MESQEGQLPLPKEGRSEILQDRSKLFHGIGFDLFRYKKILEHGILSEDAANKRGVSVARNFGGYNLNDTVSVTESPSVHNNFDHGAFYSYIKPGISFIIGGIPLDGTHAFRAPQQSSFLDSKTSQRASGYEDEAYVVHEVPRQNLEGVMLPEELLDQPLSALPIGLSKMGYGYIDNRCRSIVANLEQELGYKGDTSQLESLIKQKEELEHSQTGYLAKDGARKKLFDEMEHIIQSHIQSAYSSNLGKENVTLRDVLIKITPSDMPVFGSTGNQLELVK